MTFDALEAPLDPTAVTSPDLSDLERRVGVLEATTGTIGAGSILGSNNPAGAPSHIYAASITGASIQAGSVQADRITTGVLSAALVTLGAGGQLLAGVAGGARVVYDSTGIEAYSATQKTLDIDAATGSVTITGGSLVAGTIRTDNSPNARVEITSAGLYAYGPGNVEKLGFDVATGSMRITGVLTAGAGSALPITYLTGGSLVTGTVFRIDSGGYIETSPTNPRLVLDSAGLRGYNSGGTATFNLTSSGTFTLQTAASGVRTVLDASGLTSYDGANNIVAQISGTTATITGGTIRTAASPAARIQLEAGGLFSYSDSVTKDLSLTPSGGLDFATAASSAPPAARQVRWLLSGTVKAALYNYVSGTDNYAQLVTYGSGSEVPQVGLTAQHSVGSGKASINCYTYPTGSAFNTSVLIVSRSPGGTLASIWHRPDGTIIDKLAVGTGSTPPAYPLDVSGMASISDRLFLGSSALGEALRLSSPGNNPYIEFRNSTHSTRYGYIQMTATGTYLASEVGIVALQTGGANRVEISAGGAVGIGTATPDATLGVGTGQLRVHYDRASYGAIFAGVVHQGDSGGVQICNINQSLDRSINFQNGTTYGGRSTVMTIASGGSLSFIGRLAVANAAIDGAKPIICGSSTSNGNGAHLTNGGTWTNVSTLEAKEAFVPVGGVRVKLRKLDVESWRYKGTAERHIGPSAEGFATCFGPTGADDRGLAAMDVAGVALLAVKEQDDELAALQAQIDTIYEVLPQLTKAMQRLETKVGARE